MSRASWVLAMEGQVYVWPHGETVYVFGLVEYIRRLSGEEADAQAHRSVEARGFTDFNAFREWCRADRRARARWHSAQLVKLRPLRN